MQQQSTLQNIYSRSFPANNLIEISLVKDANPELAFYKSKYFCFLSLTPGVKSDMGGRTFNKEGRITIKTEVEKVLALAYAMRAFARGQAAQVGQFAIFVDNSKSNFSGGGGQIKTCFVSEYMQQQQQGDPKRNIVLSFKTGQNKPMGNFWSPVEALAVADVFEFIGKKGLELDLDARSQSVGTMPQQQNNFQPQPQPQPQSQPQPQQQNYSQPNQGGQQPNQQAQDLNQNFMNSMMSNAQPNQGGQQPNQNPTGGFGLDDDVPF
jgi:hypothetical protein